jgi:hypothetical protein
VWSATIQGNNILEVGVFMSYNTEQWIEKAKQVHNKYDYSLVEYINSYTKIKIICPIHGEFFQTPGAHLFGLGCKKCGYNINKTLTLIEFIEKAKQVHGNKYNYSKTVYIKYHLKIKIICPIHGEFEQTPHRHLKGSGCNQCHIDKKTFSKDEFVNLSNKIHNNKYDYSKFIYKNIRTEGIIICPIHGEILQKPQNHLRSCGCPKCGNNYSKGEEQIEKWLTYHNINYNTQHTFINCKNVLLLPFDFFLTDYNICIEFDGIHHYEPIHHMKNFINVIKRDDIKTKFCLDNNIKLIRIPYWDFNKIDEILTNMISLNVNINLSI